MQSEKGKSRWIHKVVLWTSIIVGIAIIAVSLEALRAATLKPVISTDYSQQMNELANSRLAADQAPADWQELVRTAQSLSPHFPSGTEASPDEVVDALDADAIAALQRLPSFSQAVRRWNDVDSIALQMHMSREETTPLRGTARLLRLRLQVAMKRDDAQLARETMRQWSALTAVCMHQPTYEAFISGTSIDNLLMLTIREGVIKGEVTPAMARVMLESIAPRELPDRWDDVIEATRIKTRDVAQRVFTDDGEGDGRLIQSSFASNMMNSTPLPASIDPAWKLAFEERGRQVSHWRNNMFKWNMPSRAACLARSNSALDEIREDFRKPRAQRRSKSEWNAWKAGRTSLEDHVLPYWISLELLPSSFDGAVSSRNACKILLALVAHKGRTGSYPDTLDALVPHELSALPSDPMHASGTFIYSREGETFVLYSVGADGIDNGGRMLPKQPLRALYDAEQGAGFDVVFTSPFEL